MYIAPILIREEMPRLWKEIINKYFSRRTMEVILIITKAYQHYQLQTKCCATLSCHDYFFV